MSSNLPQNQDSPEIDLFLIFKKAGDFFQGINRLIFKTIRFFIKNSIAIAVLIILGFGVGFYLDQTQKKYENQIIVAPNFESTDYLYSKIDLLQSKISEKDYPFLTNIGISNSEQITKIAIEPIVDIYKLINNGGQNIELLQLMAENGDLKTIIEETATSKNYAFHTILITTNGTSDEKTSIQPILNFLNSSLYFSKVQIIEKKNIQNSIIEKEHTVNQIDSIVAVFSSRNSASTKSDKLIYYNENTQLNSIIKTKDSLTNVLGNLKIDLLNSDKIINDKAVVLNVKNTKGLNGKMKIVLPLVLVLLFIFQFLFRAFYRKQAEKSLKTE